MSGGFIPAFGVNNWNVVTGLGLSALIGILAAVIPAAMASRLKIVRRAAARGLKRGVSCTAHRQRRYMMFHKDRFE
jgi:hypothetical protein